MGALASRTKGGGLTLLDAMGISLNKQKLVYDILTPSIIAIYKFLLTYGGSEHNIYMPVAYKGLILIDHQ